MGLNNQILFFFSALGVFNAVLMCFYFFFFKKPKQTSNYFLGVLLLMLAIRVGKSVVYYFNDDLSEIFLQIGISACLFIGPSLYFYLRYTIAPEKKSNRNWIYHLGLLFPLIILIGMRYPWELNPYLWRTILLPVIYWIWFAYLMASGFLLRNGLKKLFQKNQNLNSLEFWLLSVYVGNLVIWIAYNTAVYTSYIVGALTFSFIFYLLFLLVHFNRKKGAIFNSKLKYADKRIPEQEAAELFDSLEELMNTKKLYRNADLKLQDVASELQIIPHRLSQLLNDNLQKSFSHYINELRIAEAKEQLGIKQHLTLESIGYDCGFNSKSTFYTAFKKHTGMTPAQFKEGL